MIGSIIGFTALGLILSLFVLMIISRYSKSTWFCRKLDWHLEPKTQGFDGLSFEGTCSRCSKKVLQDSQGNWFGVGDKI